MELPKEILAIDPGKHCGWARFIDGIMKEFGTLHDEAEIYPWLITQHPQLFVVEDYKIRDETHGGFNHQWQSVFPAQVIGAVRFYACIRQIPVVMQQASIKRAAAPMVYGKPYEKKANRHHHDAWLHGAYFIKKSGLKYES
jgi:hypothetical protein